MEKRETPPDRHWAWHRTSSCRGLENPGQVVSVLKDALRAPWDLRTLVQGEPPGPKVVPSALGGSVDRQACPLQGTIWSLIGSNSNSLPCALLTRLEIYRRHLRHIYSPRDSSSPSRASLGDQSGRCHVLFPKGDHTCRER